MASSLFFFVSLPRAHNSTHYITSTNPNLCLNKVAPRLALVSYFGLFMSDISQVLCLRTQYKCLPHNTFTMVLRVSSVLFTNYLILHTNIPDSSISRNVNNLFLSCLKFMVSYTMHVHLYLPQALHFQQPLPRKKMFKLDMDGSGNYGFSLGIILLQFPAEVHDFIRLFWVGKIRVTHS